MAENLVKFVYAASATDAQIANFDSDTIYFIGSGTNGGKLYKGSTLYDAGSSAVASELAELKTYIGTLPVDAQYNDLIDYIDSIVAAGDEAISDEVTALDNSLAAVAKSGNAEDVAIADTAGNFTATHVEDALQELYTAIGTGGTNAAVTITKTTGTASDAYAYRYTFSQGGSNINNGVIDIAKDMVATDGELVRPTAQNPITIDGNQVTSGTYIAMSIANGDTFYIDVADLIEYNTVTSTDEITLTDTNHTISATVGEIAASKIVYREADSSVTPAIAKQTVAQAINALESAVGEGGNIDSRIATAIANLDSTVTATTGSVISGITQVDGVITSIAETPLAASNVAYKTSTVSAALDTIGAIPASSSATTVIDYIDEKTGSGISSLDAVVTAAVTAAGADAEAIGVINEITEVDGKLTAVGTVYADAAGAATRAKAEVIGQSGDAATASTIYGAKAYADAAVAALDASVTAAIEALDADLNATGTVQHAGTFVMSGVTQTDGVLVSVDSVEVEAAGAAAAAETAAKAYADTLLTWGTLTPTA